LIHTDVGLKQAARGVEDESKKHGSLDYKICDNCLAYIQKSEFGVQFLFVDVAVSTSVLSAW
jgi:hypothetical protein